MLDLNRRFQLDLDLGLLKATSEIKNAATAKINSFTMKC